MYFIIFTEKFNTKILLHIFTHLQMNKKIYILKHFYTYIHHGIYKLLLIIIYTSIYINRKEGKA